MVLLVAGSYRLNLFTLLNEYKEECYQYKIHYWNETYCSSSMGLGDWKNTNKENPCCDNETFNFTWGNGTKSESRWCMGSPFNKTLWNITDECDTYHLIRQNKNKGIKRNG